jgi:hypothetical protein
MKPQDILFIIALGVLIWKRNPTWFVIAGLGCLILSIPLFSFWVFFTAERLVSYAAAFFLVGIFFFIIKNSGK